MKVLSIDFENCFGIGKLNHEFDFNSSNSYLIYAPNGTMKTSFAKTLDLIAKNDKKINRKTTYTTKSPNSKLYQMELKSIPILF